jgi:hypothetical protein
VTSDAGAGSARPATARAAHQGAEACGPSPTHLLLDAARCLGHPPCRRCCAPDLPYPAGLTCNCYPNPGGDPLPSRTKRSSLLARVRASTDEVVNASRIYRRRRSSGGTAGRSNRNLRDVGHIRHGTISPPAYEASRQMLAPAALNYGEPLDQASIGRWSAGPAASHLPDRVPRCRSGAVDRPADLDRPTRPRRPVSQLPIARSEHRRDQ